MDLQVTQIPFYHISQPPNIYKLNREEKEIRKKHAKSRIRNTETFERWDLEKHERTHFLETHGVIHLRFVERSAFKDKAEQVMREWGYWSSEPSIIIHWPGLQDLTERRGHVKKYPGTPQFNFGYYERSQHLFLADDVIHWGRGNGPFLHWREVRTAEHFIKLEFEKLKKRDPT